MKHIQLTDELHQYLIDHGSPPDQVLTDLIEVTARETGDRAGMQISPEQGAFLTFLVRSISARTAIEIGTFTGYSSVCIARGLPADGSLICLDVSDDWTQFARHAWEQDGIADRVELRLGPGVESLDAMPARPTFDFAFVDADKPNYANYLERLLVRMNPSGVIAVDNVLWSGNVVNPNVDDENTVAIRKFNDMVAADPRFDAVMLPIADGLTLIRRSASAQ